MSSEVARPVISGVVVDDVAKIDRLCQAMIECATEWDWAEIPMGLQIELQGWATEFIWWMREQGAEERERGSR